MGCNFELYRLKIGADITNFVGERIKESHSINGFKLLQFKCNIESFIHVMSYITTNLGVCMENSSLGAKRLYVLYSFKEHVKVQTYFIVLVSKNKGCYSTQKKSHDATDQSQIYLTMTFCLYNDVTPW